MEKDQILHRLETANWKDIILRLTHYAIWRARRYTWRSRKADLLLGGKAPEDIACGAIEKVWSGTRDWNPDRHPDLLKHLKWIVDSDMEHLYSSMEHQKSVSMPQPRNNEKKSPEDFSEVPSDPSSPFHGKIQMPEEDLIAHEKKELEKELKGQLYDIVKGDEDLELLLLCFEDGIDKPQEIAAHTGWEVSKVYNLKRKLIRKAEKINKILRQGE